VPKYFFNYRCRRELSHDDQGIHFDNVEAAYLSAFNAAVEMWQELLRARVDPRSCAFEVMDDRARLMFVLPLAEVLESCKSDASSFDKIANRAFSNVVEARNHARRKLSEFCDEVHVTRRVLRESHALMAAVDRLTDAFAPVPPMEPARLPPLTTGLSPSSAMSGRRRRGLRG
jgi:hypothetical protein